MPIADRQRRRVMRWAAAAATTVVATGVVIGGVLLATDPSLEEQLARRTIAALQRADPTVATHGHNQPANPNRRTDIDGHELVCVAKVFGHDPTNATTVDDVRVIYAHRTCAAIGPGLAWPASIRETGPVAIRLGIPDALVLPEKALPEQTDASYADRIRAVIPTRYHDQALAYADFVDPTVADELQDEVDD
jgi:hypothetical protein